MKLIPIIIFVIIVINVLRRLAEYNRNRPQSDDNWQEWTPDSDARPATERPTPPARPAASPRPTPSERVREILERLEQADRPTPPAAAPSPRPAPVPPPVPMPPPRPVTAKAETLPAPKPASRHYLSEAAVQAAAAVAQGVETEVPHLPPPRLPDDIFSQSLAAAFPRQQAMLRDARHQQRPPFVIQAKGRQSLRRAIVLAEVLGPARAFDV